MTPQTAKIVAAFAFFALVTFLATFSCTRVAIAQPADAGAATAADAAAQTSEPEPGKVVIKMVDDARQGNWRMVASAILVLAMFALRGFREEIKWFRGDRGGAALVLVLGLSGAFASALATDAPLDWKLFVGALGVTWTAVGGYDWFRQIVSPRDKKAKP